MTERFMILSFNFVISRVMLKVSCFAFYFLSLSVSPSCFLPVLFPPRPVSSSACFLPVPLSASLFFCFFFPLRLCLSLVFCFPPVLFPPRPVSPPSCFLPVLLPAPCVSLVNHFLRLSAGVSSSTCVSLCFWSCRHVWSDLILDFRFLDSKTWILDFGVFCITSYKMLTGEGKDGVMKEKRREESKSCKIKKWIKERQK